MKTYKKTHRSTKALEAHLKKIKQRGGVAKTKLVKGGTQIDYYFQDSKEKKLPDKVIAKKSGISLKEYKKLHPHTKRELKNYL